MHTCLGMIKEIITFRDPWGRNNPPPDIDELIKSLELRLTFIWRRVWRRQGGMKKLLPSILIAIVLIYSVFGFTQLMLKKKPLY